MQDFITATNKKLPPLGERILIPILPADTLLSSTKHKKIIADIAKTINIPDEEFSILYKQLIYNFAQFVQLIPFGNTAGCSIMDLGLLRALTTIQLQKNEASANDGADPQIDTDNDDDESNDNNVDPLMAYILFSASLLFDIGSLTYNRTIIISKEDGTFIQEWLPHKGEMQLSDGNYYRIRNGGNKSLWLNRNLTPILARQLIPTIGFNWIAKDPIAFDAWLSLLLNHKEKDVSNLRSCFKRAYKKTASKPESIQSLLPENIHLTESQTTSLGDDFLEWLEHGIKNKTIDLNSYKADVHVIENGLFLEMPATIEKFCAQSPLKPKVDQVMKQLEKIGLFSANEMAKYTYNNPARPKLFLEQSEPNPRTTKKIDKHDMRNGLELLSTYFLSIRYSLKLAVEKNFMPDEIKKERKKKLLLKRKRQKKLRILRKEFEESMQVQAKMNLGIKK